MGGVQSLQKCEWNKATYSKNGTRSRSNFLAPWKSQLLAISQTISWVQVVPAYVEIYLRFIFFAIRKLSVPEKAKSDVFYFFFSLTWFWERKDEDIFIPQLKIEISLPVFFEKQRH